LHCHNNGMLGLAHRGWALNDYGQHWIHTLRTAGYHSTLIGEQHISVDPGVIGYDEVVPVDSNHAEYVAPLTIETLRDAPGQPWFMSVGFFETHRDFFAPTSVRDTLYSLPPGNLPDIAASRRDVAAFKASARSLDQGVGAVLHGLHDLGLVDNTLVICTTDHGIAFPNSKATLFDRGIGVMMIVRGPGGFTGGKVIDAPISHLDVFPTLCELAGVAEPDWLQGSSLMPLVRGEVERVREAIFAETTYHAAYQPHRAIRTERWKYIRRFDDYPHPILANCDDSDSKDVLVAAGWGEEAVAREQLYDLILDPAEGKNRAEDPGRREVLLELRERLEEWMRETDDPLLEGPVPPPPGAVVNEPWQVSASDPVRVITGDPTVAPSS
jgi:N-sulfoglucosamine sulfohydrolase